MDPTSHHIYGRIGSHSIIRPACRDSRGDAGAFEEAVSRARAIYESALEGWRKSGIEPTFHLVCGVEIPDGVPPPTATAEDMQTKLEALLEVTRNRDAEIAILAQHCAGIVAKHILEVRGGPEAGGFFATLQVGACLVAHAIAFWPSKSSERDTIQRMVEEEIKRFILEIEMEETAIRAEVERNYDGA